ncbi:Transposase [Flavobacterium columnare]|uniref:Transposase n=2 Tax=Flavobacterium TaxID=237 RepID=A0ABW8PQY4_9FLAO|nr:MULTISPECIES: transposase [Flavobacterium]QYS89566.1 transposase [Flavobacterium davisii]SPE76542.1 Transposase [Flavobacterium columnare]
MERKVKYDYAFKLRCVKEVLKKHQAITIVAKENNIGKTSLKDWISRYQEFGNKGLLPHLYITQKTRQGFVQKKEVILQNKNTQQ